MVELLSDIPRDQYKIIMKVMIGVDMPKVISSCGGYIDISMLHWPGV